MKDGHATLHDVASLAGVSVATASRALTGVGGNKKNQAKVKAAAAELGYIANEAARSLRNVKTMTVGVVFSQLNSPLSTELLDALASGLDESGHSLFLATAQGMEERFDKLVHRFLERRVDALLCVNGSGEGSALARYKAAGIPVASLFNQWGGYEKLPLIGSSISDAVDQCCNRLKMLGHHRLGVLRPVRRSRPVESFRDRAKNAGLMVRDYQVGEGPLDAYGFLNSVVTEAQGPTVIVAQQAEAVALFQAADELSIIVPRMLSIIAIRDRTMQMPATRLPMSMIHLHPALVGVEAASILVRVLSGEQKNIENVTIQTGAWLERGTVGPVITTQIPEAV